jgi:peptidoglycan/LPS O-acetylase OafA/YrhL
LEAGSWEWTRSLREPSSRSIYRPFGWFRLILALGVVMWHGGGSISPINDGILPVFHYGEMAVFAFFILSGFTITEAVSHFYPGRPYSFLLNRLVRLYPAYLVAVVLAAAVVLLLPPAGAPLPPTAGSWRNIGANLFSNFPTVRITDRILGVDRRVDFISIIWAVRVEFAFYLTVFAAMLAGRARWLRARTDLALRVLLWALLVGHAYFYYIYPGLKTASFYFGFVPYFALGVVGAVRMAEHPAGLPWKILSVVAGLFAIAHSALYPSSFGTDAIRDGTWTAARLAPPALFIVLALCVWRLSGGRIESRAKRLDRKAGEFPYPIYVLHMSAIYAITKLGGPSSFLNLAYIFAIAFGLAWLVVRASALTVDRARTRIRGGSLS